MTGGVRSFSPEASREESITMSNHKGLVRALESAVLVGAFVTIPLTLFGEENPPARWVQVADWVVWAVFLLEYIVMVAIDRQHIQYVKRKPLNPAVIVLSYPHLPVIFGLFRLARLTRSLRLLRLVGVTARAIDALRTVLWRRGV